MQEADMAGLVAFIAVAAGCNDTDLDAPHLGIHSGIPTTCSSIKFCIVALLQLPTPVCRSSTSGSSSSRAAPHQNRHPRLPVPIRNVSGNSPSSLLCDPNKGKTKHHRQCSGPRPRVPEYEETNKNGFIYMSKNYTLHNMSRFCWNFQDLDEVARDLY